MMRGNLETIDSSFYFCPKCLVLFVAEDDYSKVNPRYVCNTCRTKFDSDTYNDTFRKLGGRQYKLPVRLIENSKEPTTDVVKYIDVFIHGLSKDGYTSRDIKKITRFSIDRVRKSLSRILDTSNENEFFTRKQFMLNNLKVLEKDFLIIKAKARGEIVHIEMMPKYIVNAYNFGCTHADIEELFKITSKTVVDVIDNASNTIKLECDHRIKIKKKVEIEYKKVRRKKRKIPEK